MKLTLYTDHCLRLLAYLASRPEQLSSIGDIARYYGISHNHLTKVAHDLRKAGYLEAVRGRNGGIRLARPPEEVTLGDVVRHSEKLAGMLEAGALGDQSPLARVLGQAVQEYLAVLDRVTLARVRDAAVGADFQRGSR
jgi:Rrf2 family nitric oxide-sensitive transcriptional repressor